MCGQDGVHRMEAAVSELSLCLLSLTLSLSLCLSLSLSPQVPSCCNITFKYTTSPFKVLLGLL